MDRVLTVLLAGGKGTRLEPLTRDRAKPAVPFAGMYRVVDFALSNCINSRLFNVLALTQYKSLSLEHHIAQGWGRFFHPEFGQWLTVAAPQQRVSEQLDRMDTIIDALAEALPEAVADACREGARQAVRDAVVEILASPDLRTLVAGPAARVVEPAEPAPATAGPWTRFKAKLRAATDAVLGRCRAALGVATGRCRAATAAAAATTRTLSAVMPLKKILLVGTGVGVAVGVVSYACPHALSAAIGSVGAACTAVGVQVGTWVRRSTGLLGFGRST